jgi:hypothetical protein
MYKMRWLTIITLLVLLFPSQGVLAGYRRSPGPSISLTPFTKETLINSTVTYTVHIGNIPNNGLHCVKVNLFVPNGHKVYPGAGYSYLSDWTFYHFYAPDDLYFKVKVPNNPGRKFLNAKVSWSRDYACRSIRTTNTSNQVELIVHK